jgi:hypothetical protein
MKHYQWVTLDKQVLTETRQEIDVLFHIPFLFFYHMLTDFLKFVFILLDIGPAPRKFLLFFGAWFQLFGLFWMVTGLPIFRPLPALMKLNTESALLD